MFMHVECIKISKMKLQKIILENYRCFEKLELSLQASEKEARETSLYDNLTVLVAANGHGKTAILEAIKYLLGVFISRLGRPAPKPRKTDFRQVWSSRQQDFFGNHNYYTQKAPFMRITGEAVFDSRNVKWDMTSKRDNSAKTQAEIPQAIGTKEIHSIADSFLDNYNQKINLLLPIIAYFGTERAVIRSVPQRTRGFQKNFEPFDAFVEALDGNLNYRKLIEWMFSLDYEQLKKRDKTKQYDYVSIEHDTIQLAIERMLPGFSNLRIEREKNEPLDLYVDIEENGTFKTCSIDSQLSDGYKIVLVLVLNLVSRILEANGNYPGITAEKLLECQGVVLIDEVELHLHPSWQQRIIPDLLRTFPNIQFIVSTHSPQVISSVPKECVRIINDAQLVPFETKTNGAKAEQVLNEIFGVESRSPESEVTKAFNEYYSLIQKNEWDTERGKELQRYLAEQLSTDPDFISLATEIHIKDYQRRHMHEKD